MTCFFLFSNTYCLNMKYDLIFLYINTYCLYMKYDLIFFIFKCILFKYKICLRILYCNNYCLNMMKYTLRLFR